MSNHIERMKLEHKALKAKIDALSAFIYGNEIFKQLDELEQVRMVKQLAFMESYLSVLTERIWTASDE